MEGSGAVTSVNHAPGRPRSHDVDAAILQAALELLAAHGPEGVTMNAVAKAVGGRSGVDLPALPRT